MKVFAECLEQENPESQMSVQRVEVAQFATICVEVIGRDWFSQLSQRLFAEISSGMESVKVTIPTHIPLPSDMEKKLTDLNLVFCGLSLQSLERLDLAYCLTTKPVDFSLIKLHDPAARNLLTHIEQNYCGHQNRIAGSAMDNEQCAG